MVSCCVLLDILNLDGVIGHVIFLELAGCKELKIKCWVLKFFFTRVGRIAKVHGYLLLIKYKT